MKEWFYIKVIHIEIEQELLLSVDHGNWMYGKIPHRENQEKYINMEDLNDKILNDCDVKKCEEDKDLFDVEQGNG